MSSPTHPGHLAGSRWNPDQYLRFSDHRLRPALELLQRISLADPKVIFDLGCGVGQVTRMLAERWPDANVYGLDNSSEMLARAAAGPAGPVQWLEADIRSWRPDKLADLLYSNATLHWIENHQELFPRLVGFLKPGGCLAVQMPLSWNLPSHRIMRETLAIGGPDGKPLGSEELRQTLEREWVRDSRAYYDILATRTAHIDIWETEYLQVLEGADPVLEWVKGTGLRPVLSGLGEEEREIFLSEYSRRLRQAYPARADGCTLYPFRRLFLIVSV
jgi:trans-aconitate 2-methyltransferase